MTRLTRRANFDDKHDAIIKRIEIFEKETLPVIDKYNHKVVKVCLKYIFFTQIWFDECN